jgi:hypothetical protein
MQSSYTTMHTRKKNLHVIVCILILYVSLSEKVDFSYEEYHIPEDDTLHNHHCENLKSYRLFLCSFFQGAGHNDVELYSQYLERLKQFVSVELLN